VTQADTIPTEELRSNIGKEYIYRLPHEKPDALLRLSTDLDQIGYKFDINVRNNTRVILLSDPVVIARPQYGNISVTRVMAPGFKRNVPVPTPIVAAVWAPTEFLFLITEE
jgi:hypothetical protein